MSGRLKLKSIYPTFEEFSSFCMDTITEFYPRLVTDMPNSKPLRSEIERYVFKPLYRQFKNATCRYLPTEEGIDAFNNQFSNQLEEVVFDFLIYTSTNLDYFNESYTKVGENLEQGVTTYNSPINQDITNTKSNTTIAKGATAQNINLMVYNGNTSWLKAFSSYYTPQRKAELIDKFRWLFISFYVGSDEGVTLVELSKALSMADGNMVITPEENEILRKVIIEKPETLIPENVKSNINIGGIIGNLLSLPVDNGAIYDNKYRVRYFDVDGTILKIDYIEKGGKLNPPKSPTYDSKCLTFDTWNFDVENYIVNQPTDVGAIYDTNDNCYYIGYKVTTEATKNISLGLVSNVEINWGDGTITNEKTHTYEKSGEYTIKISNNASFDISSSKYLISADKNMGVTKMYIPRDKYVQTYLLREMYNIVVSLGRNTYLSTNALAYIKITHLNYYRNTVYSNSFVDSTTNTLCLGNINSIGSSALDNVKMKEIIIPPNITSLPSNVITSKTKINNLFLCCDNIPSLNYYAIKKNIGLTVWVKDNVYEEILQSTDTAWLNIVEIVKPFSQFENN